MFKVLSNFSCFSILNNPIKFNGIFQSIYMKKMHQNIIVKKHIKMYM